MQPWSTRSMCGRRPGVKTIAVSVRNDLGELSTAHNHHRGAGRQRQQGTLPAARQAVTKYASRSRRPAGGRAGGQGDFAGRCCAEQRLLRLCRGVARHSLILPDTQPLGADGRRGEGDPARASSSMPMAARHRALAAGGDGRGPRCTPLG